MQLNVLRITENCYLSCIEALSKALLSPTFVTVKI